MSGSNAAKHSAPVKHSHICTLLPLLTVVLLWTDIRYINGNTSCPGNTPQGLHVDSLGTKHTKLAVNFGTEDICAENGST